MILAPHGGLIEPGTSEIATRIAGDDYSLYIFEGLRKRPHSDLHITSHRYDEHQAVDIVIKSKTVVAIHGRGDNGDAETVWIGRLAAATGGHIVRELNCVGFPDKIEQKRLEQHIRIIFVIVGVHRRVSSLKFQDRFKIDF